MNIDKNNLGLKTLRNLVDITDREFEIILANLDRGKEGMQLLDYLRMLGLPDNYIEEVLRIQRLEVTGERRKYFDMYKRAILSMKTTEHNLSILRLNSFTEFENSPPLFFGMGGGSKAICKGLPFDVLSMILTAEKLKRSLGLSECRILLANRITYTNIPKNPEFSEISIDNVMGAERDLLQLVVEKFRFGKNWRIFLQTDLEKVVGMNIKSSYEDLIRKADETNLVGGHHYSIEMADIWSLVGQKIGGIKLGWFIRNIDKENGGYIMDEQPFHARYNLFMAMQNIRNTVTLAYANAGARLYPGPTGEIEKESPYICYQPNNRLLLSPFEKPIPKLRDATLAGGGFEFKYYRNLISGIIELFEELVLGKDSGGRVNRIPIYDKLGFRGDILAGKVDYIERYIFDGEIEAANTWKKAFAHI